MTDHDIIAKLDALAEEATKRPWRNDGGDGICTEDRRAIIDCDCGEANVCRTADCTFIVALVNAYPQIRAELLAARESIDTLFDAVAHGDVEHRSWLKAEISRHFAAWRVARANGGGSGE